MKYCPNCRTQYTDDSLKFCLQDGTPLAEAMNSPMKTADFGETETVVAARPPSRASVDHQTTLNDTPKKSHVGLAVALTVFVMLILFGGIGLAWWIYLKNQKTETVQNINPPINAANQNTPNKNAANTKTPTPTPKANTNANAANSTVPPANAAAIKKEVAETVEDWKSAAEALDLDAQMEKYADTVDYYHKKGASLDFVRNDRQKAFSKYDSVHITISNLTVTPDTAGTNATAVFDKEWIFDGEEKTSTGKVKTQLNLHNLHGVWFINGEKDLKAYYSE